MLQTINNNQLTFTDGRFYLDEHGQHWPSVTTLLEAYPKPYQLLQWMKEQGDNADKVRDAAGARGSAVHTLTEDYDKGAECRLIGDNGSPQYSLEVWSMFERYVDFTARFNPVHELIEKNIVVGSLGYAGTIDRVTTIEGKKYLIDIKTSNGIYNSYWLQLAAYRMLLECIGYEVEGVGILWLNAKTRTNGKKGDMQGSGWQLVTKDDTADDYSLFQSVQKLWLAENKDAKPRQFSYQLVHKR